MLDGHVDHALPCPMDLAIGRVPMRLHFRTEDLRPQSEARYEAFRAVQVQPLPIHLDSHSLLPDSTSEFCYDLEGARLEFGEGAAIFAGVRNEYALDSLLRILLSWILLPRTGFLLHAATVVRDGRAYVFTGPSGAGKSTVASFAPAGSVLTDEISLLRFEEGVWRAYGTPFWGEFRAAGSNTSAPIAGFFRLIQATRNHVRAIRPGQALRALLPNVLFFSSNTTANRRLLEILAHAVTCIPAYHLEFQRDPGFWEVLPS